MTFSNLVFSWVLFSASLVIYSPRGLLQFHLILFSYYLSIFHIIYQFSISVMLFLPPSFVSFSSVSWSVYAKNFFHYFGMSCFVGIVWPCRSSFPVFFLSPIYFALFLPVVLSDMSAVVFLRSLRSVPVCFIVLSCFANFHSFFICLSSLISHPGFVFSFGFFESLTISLLTSFDLA